jgi:two-component system nitrogen regulation response regulator GlnG
MTAYGEVDVAVAAVNQGVAGYLHKPFRLNEAIDTCQRALARQMAIDEATDAANHDLAAATPTSRPGQLIGQSTAMQQLFHQIALVADSDLSVLIVGETGTGKELVAEAIVRHSHRRDQPFVAVAPVTYNPSLLESELFGHARGAFTGADQVHQGVFEAANGGTIFLDEIGDLSLGAQVKLLRVLEQKTFSRVGETLGRHCDVRVLAATHCDLSQAVREGRFREDLLYRLGAVILQIPPLRERPEDIEPLLKHFLLLAGYNVSRYGLPPGLLEDLRQRPWPGNVRELRNVVQRAVVVARGRALMAEDFTTTALPQPALAPSELAHAIELWVNNQMSTTHAPDAPPNSAGHVPLFEQFLALAEPVLFRTVLEALGGNRSATADLLGIHRATLRERLARYGIE